MQRHVNARNLILDTHENLASFISQLPVLELNAREDIQPVDALTEVVVGQMLSRDAARAIRSRLNNLAEEKGCVSSALCFEDLRECGLSQSKAKTIVSIREKFDSDPEYFNGLSELDFSQLNTRLESLYGVGGWTVGILSLFYFGNPDVFAEKDGSIARAIDCLNAQGVTIAPEKVRPYRSYLCLYLWRMLDTGLLDK